MSSTHLLNSYSQFICEVSESSVSISKDKQTDIENCLKNCYSAQTRPKTSLNQELNTNTIQYQSKGNGNWIPGYIQASTTEFYSQQKQIGFKTNNQNSQSGIPLLPDLKDDGYLLKLKKAQIQGKNKQLEQNSLFSEKCPVSGFSGWLSTLQLLGTGQAKLNGKNKQNSALTNHSYSCLVQELGHSFFERELKQMIEETFRTDQEHSLTQQFADPATNRNAKSENVPREDTIAPAPKNKDSTLINTCNDKRGNVKVSGRQSSSKAPGQIQSSSEPNQRNRFCFKAHSQNNGLLADRLQSDKHQTKRPKNYQTHHSDNCQSFKYIRSLLQKDFLTTFEKETLERYINQQKAILLKYLEKFQPLHFRESQNIPVQNIQPDELNGLAEKQLQHPQTVFSIKKATSKGSKNKLTKNGKITIQNQSTYHPPKQSFPSDFQARKMKKSKELVGRKENLDGIEQQQFSTSQMEIKKKIQRFQSKIAQKNPLFQIIFYKDVWKKKAQIFLPYGVPVVITQESLKRIEADVFFLPYCKQVYEDYCKTKLLQYLQKETKINWVQTLRKANSPQQLKEGSVVKFQSKKSGSPRYYYASKLTSTIDKGPLSYSKSIFRQSFKKALEILSENIIRSKKGQKEESFLVAGNFFPGIQRHETPCEVINALMFGLMALQKNYKGMKAKPKEVVICVAKEDQYKLYLHEMKRQMGNYISMGLEKQD